MSETSWPTRSIRECLIESFAGEWGAEPLPGNARVLRATDIDDEGHVIGSGALRRLPIGKLTSRQLEDGDILLEGSGGGPDKPVGRVAFFDVAEHQGPAVCSNFFKTLRPDPRVVEPKFLWRKLMWFYRQPMLLTFQQQTTGIINLKFEEYLNAAIEVPANLAEQRAIAQVIETLDTAIRETEALIDKLKSVKQGLLHDLLTRGIDANGQLRPPQSEAPQLYKESPLGWIPREWDAEPLSKAIDLVSGQHIPTELCNSASKGVPYFTGPSDFLGAGTIVTQYTTCPQVMCDKGDILITVKGSGCGKVAVAGVRACISRQLMAIKVPAQSLQYWLAVFQSLQERFNRLATGGNIPGISRVQILELVVATPIRIEEAAEIGGRIQAINDRLTSEECGLAKLLLEKSGLMDDLLTGRVRVTPLLESVQQAAAQTGA